MSQAIPPSPTATLLGAAARSWIFVALVGQLLFASYVAAFYGLTAARGQLERWNEVLPHGHSPGEPMANGTVAAHLLFTVVIIVGGVLQLLPGLRRSVPVAHRWIGRLYLLSAVMLSVTGLTMAWTQGVAGGPAARISISINALLILTCAALTLRYALLRRFDVHRRWALRLLMVVSGVWFFRIGLMFWIMINGGPVGFDPESFRGPALLVIGFGQYLLPLLVLEGYLRAQASPRADAHIVMALSLFGLTAATAVGIVAATLALWWPRVQGLGA